MLVDAHQGVAQIGLARVTGGVVRNEPAARPVGEQGCRERIDDGSPYHVARHRQRDATDLQGETARDRPEHAHEADEQGRGLQEPQRQIARELREVAGILVHALVRIDPDRARAFQLEGAPRLHPILHQVADQAFAQSQLQHFLDPTLTHIEEEERAGDDGKHEELNPEFVHVPPRQGVVEGLVPAVEAYLTVRREHDDGGSRDAERHDRIARGRRP